MTRPIVHIGYHKTASTWFQRAYYPKVRNYRYVDRLVVKEAFLADSGFKFDPDRAREVLGMSHPDEPVILCEEELSGYLHNGGLFGFLSKEMAHRIHAALPNARVVVFIRRQPDIIAACYQQYLRGGGTHSPHRYLHPQEYLYGAISDPYKVPRFSFDHFEYFDLVKHYESIFGRDSVHVIPFEDLKKGRVEFLTEYNKRLGIELPLDEVEMAPKNVSYSLGVGRIARVLNRLTYRTVADKTYVVHLPGWYLVRRGILETINRFTGRSPKAPELLGKKEVAWIEDRYRETNRALAEHRGLPLSDHDYPM